DQDGYPQYRRRNNGLLYEKPGRYVVDNRYVVPFNPTLLLLLNSHINVEILVISHYSVWPEIGIEFAKKFIRLLKFEDNQLVYSHQEYKYQNSLLKQFMVLFQALTDI
ncbi:hypothetical protein ALC57_12882, partial [Trachymyrmex cornetzi]